MEQLLLWPVFCPILAGIALLFKKEFKQRKTLLVFVGSQRYFSNLWDFCSGGRRDFILPD